jgi:hypothetical protein
MNTLLNVEAMAKLLISLNLGRFDLLIALLGLVYWLNTGSRAVPGLVMLAEQRSQ